MLSICLSPGGGAVGPGPRQFFEGSAGPSDQLLPNEVWAVLLARQDPEDAHALAQLDRNLCDFALPAAQASLAASRLRRERDRMGAVLLRRAVLPLYRGFDNPVTGQAYLTKVLALAQSMGSGCSEAKALEILFAAICHFLPGLPRAQARAVLSHLIAQIERGCELYARRVRVRAWQATYQVDPDLAPAPALPWREFLVRHYELLRRTDQACDGLFSPGGWARVDKSIRAALALDPS